MSLVSWRRRGGGKKWTNGRGFHVYKILNTEGEPVVGVRVFKVLIGLRGIFCCFPQDALGGLRWVGFDHAVHYMSFTPLSVSIFYVQVLFSCDRMYIRVRLNSFPCEYGIPSIDLEHHHSTTTPQGLPCIFGLCILLGVPNPSMRQTSTGFPVDTNI